MAHIKKTSTEAATNKNPLHMCEKWCVTSLTHFNNVEKTIALQHEDACCGDARVLTRFPVQRRCRVISIKCCPHTPLITTERRQVVVHIFSRQVLKMFVCGAPHAALHSITQNCNAIEATSSSSSDSPDIATACSRFAKWCDCHTKYSSPRPIRRRMLFSSLSALQETGRMAKGRFVG